MGKRNEWSRESNLGNVLAGDRPRITQDGRKTGGWCEGECETLNRKGQVAGNSLGL